MGKRVGGWVWVVGDQAGDAEIRTPPISPRSGAGAVIIAGADFGAGVDGGFAARLRSAGVRVVVAESFAPEFDPGGDDGSTVWAVRSHYRLTDGFVTGDCVEVDLAGYCLRDAHGSAAYPLKPFVPQVCDDWHEGLEEGRDTELGPDFGTDGESERSVDPQGHSVALLQGNPQAGCLT